MIVMLKIAFALNGSSVSQSVTTLGIELLFQVKKILLFLNKQIKKNIYFLFWKIRKKVIFGFNFLLVIFGER